LVAAVANCLSDSLLFALHKFKQSPEPIETLAKGDIGRNEENRLRVLAIHVNLKLGVPAADLEHLDRVLFQFQDFCTVSSSLHPFIPVHVTVQDSLGSIVLNPA
jgi:organic hydroperoxide reductase OsmC/OhrA